MPQDRPPWRSTLQTLHAAMPGVGENAPAPQEPERKLSQPYAMFCVSCAAGCVVVPTILVVIALATLPSKVSTAFLALMVIMAVVPIAPRGRLATRFAHDMCDAAYTWFSLRIICNEDHFQEKGPYILGARLPCVVANAPA